MRRCLTTIAFCIIGWPAFAESYTTFDIADTIVVSTRAMNASETIAGDYRDEANVSHGFVRTVDGTITSFDPADSVETLTKGINSAGWIAGTFKREGDTASHAFLRAPDGTFETFDVPGALTTEVTGVDTRGGVAGTYTDAQNVFRSYLRRTNGRIVKFTPKPWSNGITTAIGQQGAILGYYSSKQHAFLRATDGTFTTFDAPGSAHGTRPLAMNAKGLIAGDVDDVGNQDHGFLRKPDGSFETFDGPDAVQTYISGINLRGVICGTYFDRTNHEHSFTRAPDGTIVVFDLPTAEVTAIDRQGITAGSYFDGKWHGFLRTP